MPLSQAHLHGDSKEGSRGALLLLSLQGCSCWPSMQPPRDQSVTGARRDLQPPTAEDVVQRDTDLPWAFVSLGCPRTPVFPAHS